MPFVYQRAGALKGPKVGTGECAALVQHYVPVGSTKNWIAGEKVHPASEGREMKVVPILHTLTLLASCIVTAPVAAASRGQRIECPAEISKESIGKPTAPQGWTALVRGSMPIQGVDVTFGPPELGTILKPKIRPNGRHYWTDLQKRLPDEDGVWLSCAYGKSEMITLGKRLDDKVSECEAFQGSHTIELRCK